MYHFIKCQYLKLGGKMGEIKVPWAINDHGKLTEINNATKDDNYYCPSCKTSLIIRKGKINVHHYAHKACDYCSQETVIHKTAKFLLQKIVSDWKNGLTKAPKIFRECQICLSSVEQPLPDKVQSAEVEVKLENGFIVDVALMGSRKILAGIEVKVTHEISSEKAELMPIPFIEIDGNVFLENPNEIVVILDKFNPVTCNECKEKLRKYVKRAKKIAKDLNIDLPSLFYRFGITSCWKCKKEILVFTWPNHSLFSKNEPLKKPKPQSIRFEYSNTIKTKYWVNCCTFCESIQGDYYLYNRSGEPFWSLDIGGDNREDYYHDMLTIAYQSEFI